MVKCKILKWLCVLCQISIAMEAMLAFLAVVEAIVAICGSVMCCKAACCCQGCCDNTPVAQVNCAFWLFNLIDVKCSQGTNGESIWLCATI